VKRSLARNARLALAFMMLTVGLTATTSLAAEWEPWDADAGNKPARVPTDINPLDQAVSIFQAYISPIDGARCPMYPTCSAYARQALHKHGSVLGMFMSVDRLLHEGDPLEQQEPITKWGVRRFYDPLSYNDFWLNKEEETTAAGR